MSHFKANYSTIVVFQELPVWWIIIIIFFLLKVTYMVTDRNYHNLTVMLLRQCECIPNWATWKMWLLFVLWILLWDTRRSWGFLYVKLGTFLSLPLLNCCSSSMWMLWLSGSQQFSLLFWITSNNNSLLTKSKYK